MDGTVPERRPFPHWSEDNYGDHGLTDRRPQGQEAADRHIPYRKNDGTAPRDLTLHAAFAATGCAAIRVDNRGSGDSEGIMPDEYHRTEQEDALQILQWLAARGPISIRIRQHPDRRWISSASV